MPAKEIFNNNKHVAVFHHESPNLLRYRWSHMAIPLAQLKDLWDETEPFIKEHSVTTLIADTLNAKSILFPDCIDWWSSVEVPRLGKMGVKKIITITSESSLTRRTNERWMGATDGIDLYEVSSFEEAKEIAKKS